MAHQVSVVIPCYIFDKMLLCVTQQCLDSIKITSDCELIVVDNGSTFGQDYMMDVADIYIRNKENTGFVVASNQGMKVASAPYIVSGTNDNVYPFDWFEKLKEVLDLPGVGCVKPMIKGDPVKGKYWVECVANAPFMWKREIQDRVGLYDERFFNNWNDNDISWRLLQHGLKTYTTPTTEFGHYGKATIGKLINHDEIHSRDYNEFIKKWGADKTIFGDIVNGKKPIGVLDEVISE